ncbi:MAG TPA: hypothetical protein VK894_06185 [Jiangellales bacterium]|nr:hypothetical protein [Jiangellales bacterium]
MVSRERAGSEPVSGGRAAGRAVVAGPGPVAYACAGAADEAAAAGVATAVAVRPPEDGEDGDGGDERAEDWVDDWAGDEDGDAAGGG